MRFGKSIALFAIACGFAGFWNEINAQTYEVGHDSLNAKGWFGGDNRPNFGPRNVGIAKSVYLDTSITVESFAFYFYGPFDYSYNADGRGHEVTLTLHARDAQGEILQTRQVVLPDTFQQGWVEWDGFDVQTAVKDTLIFSAYLVGGADSSQYSGGYGADHTKSFTRGVLYGKNGKSDAEMDSWENWSEHPNWSAAFRLRGTISTPTSVNGAIEIMPEGYVLLQNYPNPFNPETTISYRLSFAADVELAVFDLNGRLVRTLVQGRIEAGEHKVRWDGRDSRGEEVASGVYLYRLRAGQHVLTQRMILLR